MLPDLERTLSTLSGFSVLDSIDVAVEWLELLDFLRSPGLDESRSSSSIVRSIISL